MDWAVPGMWDRPTPPVEPTAAVRALVDAMAALDEVDPSALSPEQALVDAEALHGVAQALRRHLVRRSADVDERELFAMAGARSAASWVRTVQPDADVSDVTLARRGRRYRHLQDALDEGLPLASAKAVVSALDRCGRHVDNGDGLIDGQPADEVVTAVVRNVRSLVSQAAMGLKDDDPSLVALEASVERIVREGGSELDRIEKAFVLLAGHVPVKLLKGMLEELYLAIVPSELDRRLDQSEAEASILLRKRPNGLPRWTIDPDQELHERMLVALHAEMRRDSENPLDTAAAARMRELGLDPHNPDDYPLAQPPREPFSDTDGVLDGGREHPDFGPPRCRAKRMHDAFSRMLGRYLENGLAGQHQKVPVQINVTCTDAAATGQPGALPARTDNGQLIGRRLVRRWWCDSRVTAFVLSRGGKALRAVHLGRTLTALERRAALIEHGNRCAGLDCCRLRRGDDPDPTDIADLVPHHVIGYAKQGTTALDETLLFCRTAHHDIHHGKVVRLRDGRLVDENGFVDPADLRRRDEAAPF